MQRCDLSKFKVKKIANYGQKGQTYLIKCNFEPKMSDFFRPPTLTGHSFADPRPMLMHSSSKPYLFAHYLINSISAHLRYVILAQSNPIYLVPI